MVDPLIVDTSRLAAAGDALRALVLPAAPAGVTAPGADAISAAINETMPVVESPVIEGLPAAQSALQATAAKILSAATTYAATDESLGDQLGEQRFDGAIAAQRATAAPSEATTRAATARAATGETPAAAANAGPATDSAAQLGQLGAAAGSAVTSVQGVVQSIQGGFGGSAPGGTPTSVGRVSPAMGDTEPPTGTESAVPIADRDGAAAGERSSDAAPVQADSAAPEREAGRVAVSSGRGGHDAVE